MEQIKEVPNGKEVRQICFFLWRQFSSGKMTQEELEKELRRIELSLSPQAMVSLDLFGGDSSLIDDEALEYSIKKEGR